MATTSSVSNTNSSDILAALNASSSGSSASKKKSAIDESQNKFLTLLTTQLKNQDPLNPMDNAQMTSQLAQINTVQGITQLNSTLQTMLDNNYASQAVQAAALVGKGVVVPGSALALSSGQSLGGYELASAADSVSLAIKDSSGSVIRTINQGAKAAGLQTFSWDGTNDAGAQAADGSYSFSVTATQGTTAVGVTKLQVGAVGSVSGKGSNLTVNVTGVGSVALSDIREIL